MVRNRKGQITVEAVLIIVLFVAIGTVAARTLNDMNAAASLVQNPWRLLSGMIESGVWREQAAAAQLHPNLKVNRRLSLTGELEPASGGP